MTQEEKDAVVDQLTVVRSQVYWAENLAAEAEQGEQADQLNAQGFKIKKLIDDIIRENLEQWAGDVAQVQQQFGQAIQDVQKAISDIESHINVAQNLIKAIGQVEEVIRVASQLLPAAPAAPGNQT